MAEPPTAISDFFEQVRGMSIQDLTELPDFIDLEANERLVKHPRISVHAKMAVILQEDYPLIQGVFFDFNGRCSIGCPQETRHIHGIQASGVLQVKDFPGLYIYPKLLLPVLPELLDTVMGLHESGEVDESKEALSLDHEDAPGRQALLPPKFRSLIRGSFPMMFNQHDQATRATIYTSTPERQHGLRQSHATRSVIPYLSLGCDAVLVIGNENTSGESQGNHTSNETQQKDVVHDSNSWKDFISLDSDDEDKSENKQSIARIDHSSKNEEHSKPKISPRPGNVSAIHLRAGDVLLLDNKGTDNWYGIAKVLEGSSRSKQQWPHIWRDEQRPDSLALRGQLCDKTIEVEIR